MTLPPSVSIGYRTYPIQEMPDSLKAEDTVDTDGMFNRTGIYIHLRDPCNDANTLLHEILHGCWLHGGLESRETEERAVTALANQLCQVLKDNSNVVNFILNGLK